MTDIEALGHNRGRNMGHLLYSQILVTIVVEGKELEKGYTRLPR
jgi:hypothetical protein